MDGITKARRSREQTDPIRIGLVQINNSFSNQNYLPYSTALLQAYVEANASDPGRYEFPLHIYKRQPISETVARLQGVQVAGFSTYVWNGRISLEIARRLKAADPDILIVFGGPHVPDHPEDFLRGNPFIDIVVHNEGEQTFLELLEGFGQRNWTNLAGVSYIDPASGFFRNPDRARMRDLEEVPSPFLSGAFDGLMAANPDENWIGLWETNRGCPFQCTFCDWGSATAAKVTKFGQERLEREIDWFSDNRIEYIFCCDANFGIQKRDVELTEYVARVKRETGYPQALSVQNTKNATERAYLTQKILADGGLNKGVALSMQSVDGATLGAIKRQNISLDTYLELQRRFTRDRVETYSDLILALPDETYDTFVDGVDLLITNGQHNRIQFNNLSILPNAEMGNLEYQAKYGMVTVESEIINIHGERIELEDDVAEVQELVIATDAMPLDAWRRTRSFCWMTALLYFDKLFQIPLMTAHGVAGLSYREMFEAFLDVDAAEYPLIGEICDFFLAEAESIQKGGAEYTYSERWLGIYWPADEYVFVKLTAEGNMDAFYDEAGALLKSMAAETNGTLNWPMIDDAIALNRSLVKQPFIEEDISVNAEFDVIGYWQDIRNGADASLTQRPISVAIDRKTQYYDDFQTWCREVVWWGNKKGAYLYNNHPAERQMAGHF